MPSKSLAVQFYKVKTPLFGYSVYLSLFELNQRDLLIEIQVLKG